MSEREFDVVRAEREGSTSVGSEQSIVQRLLTGFQVGHFDLDGVSGHQRVHEDRFIPIDAVRPVGGLGRFNQGS